MTINTYLINNGIKPSFQRMKIMDYLLNNKTHPTVDIIYKDLVPEIPTLSKTTVYNTLNLFAEKSVVQIINIENNEVRYDGDISFHGHFKCEKCGNISDFKVNMEDLKFEEIEDFDIKQTHIYIKGVCKKCNKRYET